MLYQAQTIRILSLLMLFCLIAGLSGCSSTPGDFRDPEVRLVKVDVVRAKLLEQQFILRFRIDNPNDRSLPVRGLIYTVHLNDVELASGESSGWLTVPANSFEYYEVPVHTNLWRHMKYIVRLLEKPDRPINYRLAGELNALNARFRLHS